MAEEIGKKLSVIKQLIELGDQEAIAMMARGIRQSTLGKEYHYITNALENQRFEDALLLIEDFERQQRQVARHYDPIVSALKVELLFQEDELSLLRSRRDELAKMINNFQIRYHSIVGDLLDRMLYLRKEKLRMQAAATPAMQAIYEAAEKEYEEYHEAHRSPIQGILYSLDDDEQRELKRLYRKACLICHPDRAAEEHQEKAEAMFAELHEAYMHNDIRKVRLIAELLEKAGQFEPKFQQLDDAEALRLRIERIMLDTEEVEAEIADIKASEAFRTVEGIGDDWSSYFKRVAENLQAQVAELEHWLHLHSSQN